MKYVDQNNDGIIDDKDQVYLARGGWYGAPLALGINLTAKWKGLTFFVLGTGEFGGHAMKNNESYYWISGEDKYSAVVRGRWTPETAATATYPRLTTESGTNNFYSSDFWMYKTDAFRLAKYRSRMTCLPSGLRIVLFMEYPHISAVLICSQYPRNARRWN